MRTSFLSSVVLALAVALGSPARAAVIDLESAATGGTVPLPYTEDGFTLSVQSGLASDLYINNPNPGTSPSTVVMGNNGTIRLTRDGGGLFDAVSVQLPPFILSPGTATITSSAGGSRLLTNADNNTTVALTGPAFTNLTHLDFVTASFVPFTNLVFFDNITVTPVPEPSVAAIGLLAVGMLARRRARKC